MEGGKEMIMLLMGLCFCFFNFIYMVFSTLNLSECDLIKNILKKLNPCRAKRNTQGLFNQTAGPFSRARNNPLLPSSTPVSVDGAPIGAVSLNVVG